MELVFKLLYKLWMGPAGPDTPWHLEKTNGGHFVPRHLIPWTFRPSGHFVLYTFYLIICGI